MVRHSIVRAMCVGLLFVLGVVGVNLPLAAQEDSKPSPEVTISNSADVAIVTVRIDENSRVRRLAPLLPGESNTHILPVGAKIGFMVDRQLQDDTYLVTDALTQDVLFPLQSIVSLPDTLRRAAHQKSTLRVANTTQDELTVYGMTEDEVTEPLVQLAPNQIAQLEAAEGLYIFFYSGDEKVGDPYIVGPQAQQAVSAPYTLATLLLAGDGNRKTITANNRDSEPYDIYLANDEGSEPVGTLERFESKHIQGLVGQVIYFANGDEVVGDPYKITDADRQSIFVPYKAPLLLDSAKGKKVRVEMLNYSPQELTIVTFNEDGDSQILDTIAPLGGAAVSTLPGFKLAFFVGEEQVGGNYSVTEERMQSINVPSYETTLLDYNNPPAHDYISNPTDTPLTVVLSDGERSEVIAVVPPHQGHRLPGVVGMTYFFFKGVYDFEDSNLFGDPYVIVEQNPDGEIVAPYKAPTFVERARGTKTNVTIKNTLNDKVSILAQNSDEESAVIAVLRPYQSLDVPSASGLTYFFYTGDGEYDPEKIVGYPYEVTASHAQRITLPYEAPDMVQSHSGAKAVLTVTNTKNVAVSVAGMAGETSEILKVMAPGETYNQDVFEGLNLFFYEGDELTDESVVGFPFVVEKLENRSIEVPFIDIGPYVEIVVQSIVDQMVADQLRPSTCWRDSYGRGVGTIPDSCPDGKSKEDGLCYEKCASGYSGAATMCRPNCPAGFTDTGLHCLKGSYVRDAYPWELGDDLGSLDEARERCKKEHGKNCVTANSSTIVYETCKSGYKNDPVVTNTCRQVCPSNMTDIGVSCQMHTYDRGIGKIGNCSSNEEEDAGLCYKKCEPGHHGVGPVCWASCPADLPVNCGASCAKTQADCAVRTSDQITTPFIAVGGAVLTVLTAGAGGAATKAGSAAVKTGVKVATKAGARAAAKAAISKAVKKIVASRARNLASALVDDAMIGAVIGNSIYAAMNAYTQYEMRKQIGESVQAGVEEMLTDPKKIDTIVELVMKGVEEQKPDEEFPWELLDPTGIADVVIAYNIPICSNMKTVEETVEEFKRERAKKNK